MLGSEDLKINLDVHHPWKFILIDIETRNEGIKEEFLIWSELAVLFLCVKNKIHIMSKYNKS